MIPASAAAAVSERPVMRMKLQTACSLSGVRLDGRPGPSAGDAGGVDGEGGVGGVDEEGSEAGRPGARVEAEVESGDLFIPPLQHGFSQRLLFGCILLAKD